MAFFSLLPSRCSLSAKILQALTLLDLPHSAKCNILAGCWQRISWVSRLSLDVWFLYSCKSETESPLSLMAHSQRSGIRPAAASDGKWILDPSHFSWPLFLFLAFVLLCIGSDNSDGLERGNEEQNRRVIWTGLKHTHIKCSNRRNALLMFAASLGCHRDKDI